MNNVEKFCEIIRSRSNEHKSAIDLLYNAILTGSILSILRQELDSMVRVIFLLNQSLYERIHLINSTLNGQKWKLLNNQQVTDKQMVDLASNLNGWEKYVYKFGCAFIHLSSFHDYSFNNPFENLTQEEADSVKNYLNSYHNFPLENELTVESVFDYLPMVFNKIRSNLEYYLVSLENQQ